MYLLKICLPNNSPINYISSHTYFYPILFLDFLLLIALSPPFSTQIFNCNSLT